MESPLVLELSLEAKFDIKKCMAEAEGMSREELLKALKDVLTLLAVQKSVSRQLIQQKVANECETAFGQLNREGKHEDL